jgi:hypothetical protein
MKPENKDAKASVIQINEKLKDKEIKRKNSFKWVMLSQAL